MLALTRTKKKAELSAPRLVNDVTGRESDEHAAPRIQRVRTAFSK